MYMMTKCDPKDTSMAKSKYGLRHGGICTSEPSSDNALSALNISMATRTVKDKVEAFILPPSK